MVERDNQQVRAIQDSLENLRQLEEVQRRNAEIQKQLDSHSSRIYFIGNKAGVREYSSDDLNAIVRILNEYPELRITAIGFRNSDDTQYAGLSKRRALVVKEMLVQRGVEASRIVVRDGGLSTKYPKQALTDSHGNTYTLNMRVELKIIR
jgi:outer membrane protein OmpA-like peptidoglycan-associated protein